MRYSDLLSGEETSMSPSPVLRRDGYRAEAPKRPETPTRSLSRRSPARSEEKASRERQGGLPPILSRSISGSCYEYHQSGHFRRDCSNRSMSRSVSPLVVERHVSFQSPLRVWAVTRVISSVRCGVLGYGESAWQIPVQANGVDISAVVDTAVEITILSETVYDSMSPSPGCCLLKV